ncbi:hypothetical protein EDB83DRAFT_2317369 [Lactarius deliciosus]|nr:hypothetical protein EDB83DRAFT_2317369 [Lactarius deliciosus]
MSSSLNPPPHGRQLALVSQEMVRLLQTANVGLSGQEARTQTGTHLKIMKKHSTSVLTCYLPNANSVKPAVFPNASVNRFKRERSSYLPGAGLPVPTGLTSIGDGLVGFSQHRLQAWVGHNAGRWEWEAKREAHTYRTEALDIGTEADEREGEKKKKSTTRSTRAQAARYQGHELRQGATRHAHAQAHSIDCKLRQGTTLEGRGGSPSNTLGTRGTETGSSELSAAWRTLAAQGPVGQDRHWAEVMKTKRLAAHSPPPSLPLPGNSGLEETRGSGACGPGQTLGGGGEDMERGNQAEMTDVREAGRGRINNGTMARTKQSSWPPRPRLSPERLAEIRSRMSYMTAAVAGTHLKESKRNKAARRKRRVGDIDLIEEVRDVEREIALYSTSEASKAPPCTKDGQTLAYAEQHGTQGRNEPERGPTMLCARTRRSISTATDNCDRGIVVRTGNTEE